ncbi:hypothetical protein LR48_Vigan102s000400 [Vigna angularis]|uniref:Uncharacterized protein n=1 Tax=Phaseolus angularis TaxID=3914 RepID=A0A0L9T4R5_PHAAN|nr:hypothetical protein LR48_Vigan102s000400 [Vigna angularis]
MNLEESPTNYRDEPTTRHAETLVTHAKTLGTGMTPSECSSSSLKTTLVLKQKRTLVLNKTLVQITTLVLKQKWTLGQGRIRRSSRPEKRTLVPISEDARPDFSGRSSKI